MESNQDNKKREYENKLSTDTRIFKVDDIPTARVTKSYCIFRIGKKFKTVGNIKGFFSHMERARETPNASIMLSEKNQIILSACDSHNVDDIYADIKNYLKDVKIYQNSTIGRELLLTASPQFFKGITKQEFEKWVDMQRGWLVNKFGENCRYAVLHLWAHDETTPHVHALVIPKFYLKQRKSYTLQSYQYFDGADKLRDFQDDYANTMRGYFKCLERGIRGSKAQHIKMKTFYALINQDTSKLTREQLEAKAKQAELLQMKMKYMDKTLKSFQYNNSKKDETNIKLQKEVKRLEAELKVQKNEIRELRKQKGSTEEKVEKKKGFTKGRRI